MLAEIGAGAVPRLLVFNKIDRVGDAEAEARATRGLLGALARRDRDVGAPAEPTWRACAQRWSAFFARDLVEEELRVPYDRQELRGEIFAACEVLEERYEDDAVVFRVRAHPAFLERLQRSTAPQRS